MVTSLVLTGMYNVGVNQNGRLKLPDGTITDLKSIPFVRYRFDKYDDAEIEFIKNNIKKFPCTHVAEIALSDKTVDYIDAIDELEVVGKMVYVDVTDNEVAIGLRQDQVDLLEGLIGLDIDRLSIRDKSTTLDAFTVNRLKKDIKDITQIPMREIGVCGGPCCFANGDACLTALKAREIASKYMVDGMEDKSPSANHQGRQQNVDDYADCVNKCGCIRYYVISADTEAPAVKNSDSTKAKKPKEPKDPTDTKESKSDSEKVEKKPVKKGKVAVIW